MVDTVRRQYDGFTLVELLIVLAILGAIIGISIPLFSGYISRAEEAADAANLRVLNSATRVYEFSGPSPDPFETAGTSDDALIQALITAGFLDGAPVPRQKDVSFTWDFGNKIWTLSTVYVLTASDVTMGTGGHTGYIKGSYSGSAKTVFIPRTIDGVVVTAVYQEAFMGKGLTSVTFAADSGVAEIHARAFKNNSLSEIILPASLRKLDYGAFYDNDIVKVTIGAGVEFESKVFRNSDSFRDAYYAQGAGTYAYTDGVWVKQ